jgi:DNA polymerase-3 subunit alpha
VPDLSEGLSGPLVISMPEHKANEQVLLALKDILGDHGGTTEVKMHLAGSNAVKVMKLPLHHRVNPTPALFGDLKVLLGPACLEG